METFEQGSARDFFTEVLGRVATSVGRFAASFDMRIRLLSDLHFEFHADGGAEFVASLDNRNVDVLVLAGDIAVGEGIGPALTLLCHQFARATVIYVHGNHEFYGSSRSATLRITETAASENRNLVWLDGTVATIHGRRFLGAPLWFRRDPSADRYKRAMADFGQIPEYESWVYAENERAVTMFHHELREGDCVVTHHLPAQKSVAAQFRSSRLNAFFLCDLEDLILERSPALWLHGHTHSSVYTAVGNTLVACNPFGYVGYELNAGFDAALTIEV